MQLQICKSDPFHVYVYVLIRILITKFPNARTTMRWTKTSCINETRWTKTSCINKTIWSRHNNTIMNSQKMGLIMPDALPIKSTYFTTRFVPLLVPNVLICCAAKFTLIRFTAKPDPRNYEQMLLCAFNVCFVGPDYRDFERAFQTFRFFHHGPVP